MTDSPAAVQVKNLSVYYDSVAVLEDIDLTVERRDYLGIIGPNGGGKTTLLRSLLGLVRPNRGSIKILGRPPSQAHDIVAYVPQYTLFDRQFPISVWDVVLMGRVNRARLFHAYGGGDKAKAESALELVGMQDSRHRQIGRLSGGQLQRVLIARAIASEPEVLLLDEPTSSIDIESESNLYELLGELNRSMTIILVSHDIGVISQHVNSVACLNRKLFYHGSKDLSPEVIESVYGCPVDMIAHGTPHRVLKGHFHPGGEHA